MDLGQSRIAKIKWDIVLVMIIIGKEILDMACQHRVICRNAIRSSTVVSRMFAVAIRTAVIMDAGYSFARIICIIDRLEVTEERLCCVLDAIDIDHPIMQNQIAKNGLILK